MKITIFLLLLFLFGISIIRCHRFCQEPFGTVGQSQFRDLRSVKLICGFQFRELPPSASGMMRQTRERQEQEEE